MFKQKPQSPNKKTSLKAGVSLITVLLFMMIATIAATATYKWITSEGRSSASRMLQREAYQSAVAGIENARAWMTYHANDVGGLVTQYFQNEKKPILLDTVLKPFTNEKQDYNVWLTGVNTQGSSYKLKLLSSGKSRNGTVHNEVAILNVSGLYQVLVPQTKDTGTIDFEYAYFGGGYSGAGNVQLTSGVINGNWKGNPQSVTKSFVVTGNAELSGNNVNVGELACIGGKASIQNNGLNGKNLYAGEFSGALNLSGDAYFAGNVKQEGAGAFDILGSVTLNGKLTTTSAKNLNIRTNFCMGDDAQVYSAHGTGYKFSVDGGVWIPGKQPFWADSNDLYDKIILGKDENSKIYIKAGHPWSDYDALRKDRVFYEADSAHSGHPRKCNGADSRCTKREWWSNEKTNKDEASQIYKNKANKANLFYIYYMPEGWTDVTFATYKDTYWKWPKTCWWGVCDDPHTIMGSYIINYPGAPNSNNQKDFPAEYAFTDSSHSETEGKNVKNSKGWYRYLNHDGNNPTASPFCKLAAGKNWRPECDVKPWFRVNGAFQENFPAEKPEDLACAEQVKTDCDSIWIEEPGCDGAKYKVKDPLVTAKEQFEPFASKGCAANITKWDKSPNLVDLLNACYKENMADSVKKKENLYNGFLVVNVSGGSDDSKCPTGTLDGKFVIIADDPIQCQNNLPGTTDETFVMLYLEQGANKLGGRAKNYFIYTEQGVKDGLNFHLDGTIYIPTDACKGLGSLQSSSITYNPTLVQELTEAGVICNNDGSPCGGSSADTESSLGGVDLGDYILSGRDIFYVATAPQLGITLESQYETREKEPEVTADAGIDPSILILPRVSYLTTDAIGKLSDYYNVINLNGADEVKDPSAVMCTPTGLNTTSALYDGTTPITEGVYTCVYQSSKGYGSVPFYIVVSGKSGDAPTIAFTTDNQEVLKGTTVDVYLKIPESTRPNPINVDLLVSELPEGWTLNPTTAVSLRDNSSGTAVYTVTAQPASGSATDVHIFTVGAGNSALNGSVLLQLVAPCDGCVIGMPSSQTIFATGYANFKREGLTEYCTAFPDACDSDDLDAAQRPDCDVSAEWVRAVGMNCRVEEVNNRWTCGTNQAVSLQSLTLPNYCELFMPSENNSHSILEDGKDYTLYASLKKKPYTLTVKIDGADESSTSVTIVTDSKSETCLQTDDACDFTVYAGENVSISYSAETDKFSYWKCSGDNCPVELTTSSPFTLQPISGNNTVTAKFNDKDKHCFYEDFSNLTAFCDNNEHCIRDCSEPSGCIVSGTTTVDWQLMQKDGSNTPAISSGFITTPAMNKGKQTFIMSTKQAGANGQMTSMLQTAVVREADRAEMYNSGFVVRSNTNASSYLLLNVYGVGEGSYGTLTTRLCKGDGLTSVGSCTEKQLMNGSSTAEISATTMINMSLTADKDTILVEARVNGTLYATRYDISSFNMTSQEYQYVGFKLSDETTKLYDIAWRSSDYADDCWSVPTVDCSFKANYLGGLVPKDSNVTPWVGASSWFTDHSCEYKYYYNGNDNITTTAGTVDGLGSALASKDYNFSEEGLHGPESKDAKVSVECPDNTTSLNGQNTSCGNFWVGKQMACSQNYEILNEVVGISDAEREFPVSVSGANLREAVLKFTVSDLPDGEKITVYLKDVDGSLSLPGTIKANGNQEISIESILNKDNFNPQKVVAVLMSATTVANVSTIYSDCPYAFAITGCSASYNGSSWIVSASFKNIEGAETNGCSVVPSDGSIEVSGNNGGSDVTEVTCPDAGNFAIVDPDLYTRVNQGVSGVGYSFTVKAIAKDGAEVTCVTDEVVIEPTEITCSVTPEQVVQGTGMPTLQMSIANAPTDAPYTLKFNGTQFDQGQYVGGGVQYIHSYGEANKAENPLTIGTYSYVIEAIGKTKECSFEVVEAIEADASCSVSGNTLSVTVKGANYGDAVPVKVGISDVIGNVLGFESISMDQNTTKEIDLSTYNNQLTAGTSYPVTLTLNGVGQSCGEYTPPLPELTLQCPADLYNKNASEPVTITPTVSGCNVVDGCNWTITPATDGGSGTDYTSGSMSFTNTNGSGTVKHTINITRPKDNATKSCNFDVVFIEGSGSVSATCGVSTYNHGISGENDFYTSANLYFVFKNNASNATTPSVEIFKDGASVGTTTLQSWSNWNSTSIGKLSEGSYTYNLKHNGKVICTHSINVKSPLSCSVDKTTIGLGESFKFTTNYAGSAWGHSLSGNGAPASTGGSAIYTITPTAIGTHTYTFSVTSGDKGSAECSYSVIVEEVPPTITCPADLTGIALNSNVSVTPQSLTGCTNGCDYTIDGTSATGSGYTGGEVSFTGESAAGEKTYTWNVSNSKGSDECEFKVTYEEGGSVVNPCECSSYCNDCSAIKTNSGTYNSSDYNCIFFTSASKLNIGGSATKINGVAVTNTNSCYDATTCENNLNALGITKVNGGYYMSLPSWNYTDISISGSIPTECAGGGSGGGGSGTDPDPGAGGSGGSEFACNESNSTNVAKEADYSASANGCIKYVMDGASNIQIGCWWAPSTPVSVKVQTCNGSVTTISHSCGGWVAVPVGGTCSIFLETQGQMNLKFNNW
jgi:Tfp pilus assembly protein PilX